MLLCLQVWIDSCKLCCCVYRFGLTVVSYVVVLTGLDRQLLAILLCLQVWIDSCKLCCCVYRFGSTVVSYVVVFTGLDRQLLAMLLCLQVWIDSCKLCCCVYRFGSSDPTRGHHDVWICSITREGYHHYICRESSGSGQCNCCLLIPLVSLYV